MKATRRSLSAIVLSGAMVLAAAVPAFATHTTQHQLGGAAGLVAAVVQVQTGDISIANRSLNNLLRNADIDVLNNVLNNLLRDADIDVTITDINVNLLTGVIEVDVLNVDTGLTNVLTVNR